MNTHHEKRVRQLLGIKNNEDGSRGEIPPAAVEAIERIECMLTKLGSAASLRATELAIILTAIGIGKEEGAKEVAPQRQPISAIDVPVDNKPVVEQPRPRGRPKKTL